MGRALRLAAALPSYAALAWWGLVAPRRERAPLVVHQAVIVASEGVALAMRRELRRLGAAGGRALPGESPSDALRREGGRGDRPRRGDRGARRGVPPLRLPPPSPRASTAAASIGGALRASAETPAVAWFDPIALPRTLFPWFRGPLADALAELPEPSP
jgi:hypothetical protein